LIENPKLNDMIDIFKKYFFLLPYNNLVVFISSATLRFTHLSNIEHNYSQHQFAWSRFYQGKCRYCYCCLLLFLPISRISPTVNHHSIRLFFSFASSSKHTHTHTFIHSHILTHTHSHPPEPRTRTDKKEKLTPYARFQSVCRPSLREASNRMIIAIHLFAC
jgi:hypothetical protein